MKRVISAVITIATAATATIAVVAAITPAMAAQHPARSRPASHAKLIAHAKTARHGKETPRDAKLAVTLPEEIASEFKGGKYVTIVRCSGTVTTPAPVRIARPDVPLLVHGGALEAKIVKLLAKPHTYKTIYKCTVVVKEKVPSVVKKVKKVKRATHKKSCEIGAPGKRGGGKGAGCSHIVTLNTGFGGAAGPVAGHHPAG
jgi:hypothetical protein